MDRNSFDLKIRPMSQVATEAVRYIKARKEHTVVSLKTRWKKFNSQCMGGIEPNTIYTITGISGSGKSSWANLVQTDLIDLNPEQDVIVLTFSLEMVGFRQVGRTLSSKLRKTTSALYSAYERLDDNTFQQVIDVTNQLKDYPIYFVDDPGSPAQVGATIRKFYDTYVKGTGKYFIIIYDHTLLTKQVGTTIETMSELEKEFISIKKLPLTSIIQLSQMNRNIEEPERRNNPSSHYPMRSDLSSSDAIFQASDYVIVLHRPEQLNIHEYGPNRLPTANKVYLHILKNRDAGKPCILEFENDLAYNNIIEPQMTSTN
jgi:replicative DNA helicase